MIELIMVFLALAIGMAAGYKIGRIDGAYKAERERLKNLGEYDAEAHYDSYPFM